MIAEAVLPFDGVSRALGASGPLAPDARLLAGLRAAADDARVGVVVSADVRSATAPGAVANSVSSPPRPTLSPGWKWVPR